MDGKFQVNSWTGYVFFTGLRFQWLVLEDVSILGVGVGKSHLESLISNIPPHVWYHLKAHINILIMKYFV